MLLRFVSQPLEALEQIAPFPGNDLRAEFFPDQLPCARDVLIVVPSHGLRDTLTQIKPLLGADARICWATTRALAPGS